MRASHFSRQTGMTHSDRSARPSTALPTAGISLMAKPAGYACNIRCHYCFYLEKEALYPDTRHPRMSDRVLEAYVQACVALDAHNPQGVNFVWQGGEPTLMGLDFYRRALALEKMHAGGRAVHNAIQTNGVLLDDAWCEFLAEHGFLVGLSLDGPRHVHDRFRRDARGDGTHRLAMRALRLLQKHGVQYNVLASVAADHGRHLLASYRFLRQEGVRHIQFIPVVEPAAGGAMAPWSVDPASLGDGWVAVFDEWVRHDVGDVFVMNFEWLTYAALGGEGPVCTMQKRCGRALVVEHNGDVYACDHYVYPHYRLGNLLTDEAAAMVCADRQRAFGAAKEDLLADECRRCDVLSMCRGGCPKQRFGQPGEAPVPHHLCAAYRALFRYARKYAQGMGALLRFGYPPRAIMHAIDRPLALPGNAATGGKAMVLWLK